MAVLSVAALIPDQMETIDNATYTPAVNGYYILAYMLSSVHVHYMGVYVSRVYFVVLHTILVKRRPEMFTFRLRVYQIWLFLQIAHSDQCPWN